MKTSEIDLYFKKLLNIEDFSSIDASNNSLQVDNDGKDIAKIAFAVDASYQTIKMASSLNADMLFVHHGLFWGKPLMLTDSHYRRIKELLNANLALYACHLPLDAHHIFGNNATLADRIGLEDREGFAFYKGCSIGVMGHLPTCSSIDEVLQSLFPNGEKPCHILPFGNPKIRRVGILSGSGASSVDDAIKNALDLFITGEIKHESYNKALEGNLSIIAGGHYNTETVGLLQVKKKIECDFALETCFIDMPTGL